MHKRLFPFDSQKHHICLEFAISDSNDIARYGLGILDTGAPRTEFSDIFLNHIGLLETVIGDEAVPHGQQTLKYRKLEVPSVEICGYHFRNAEFIVSTFERTWGVDALIGLDLFRKCRITIDYRREMIIAEPY